MLRQLLMKGCPIDTQPAPGLPQAIAQLVAAPGSDVVFHAYWTGHSLQR